MQSVELCELAANEELGLERVYATQCRPPLDETRGPMLYGGDEGGQAQCVAIVLIAPILTMFHSRPTPTLARPKPTPTLRVGFFPGWGRGTLRHIIFACAVILVCSDMKAGYPTIVAYQRYISTQASFV